MTGAEWIGIVGASLPTVAVLTAELGLRLDERRRGMAKVRTESSPRNRARGPADEEGNPS